MQPAIMDTVGTRCPPNLTRSTKKCLGVGLAVLLAVYLFIITRVSETDTSTKKEMDKVIQTIPKIYLHMNSTESHFPFLERDLTLEQRLVYNRVPKCGSSTSSALFKELSVLNDYTMFFVLRDGSKSLSAKTQRQIIEQTNSASRPWMYIQHFHLFNFTDHGEEMPVHINIVRDPIDRLMSAYYYKRFKAPRPMSDKARNTSFEDCVVQRQQECTYLKIITVILPYFCGSHPRCTEKPNVWALQRAKQNVERYYSLVGHVDELANFYTLLEKTMPQYFNGLMKLYKKNVVLLKSKTSTREKKTLSSSSRQYLRSRLGMEYEFFYFIKRRFKESYKKVMGVD